MSKLPKVQKNNKEKDDLEQRNYWKKKIHNYTTEKYKRYGTSLRYCKNKPNNLEVKNLAKLQY